MSDDDKVKKNVADHILASQNPKIGFNLRVIRKRRPLQSMSIRLMRVVLQFVCTVCSWSTVLVRHHIITHSVTDSILKLSSVRERGFILQIVMRQTGSPLFQLYRCLVVAAWDLSNLQSGLDFVLIFIHTEHTQCGKLPRYLFPQFYLPVIRTFMASPKIIKGGMKYSEPWYCRPRQYQVSVSYFEIEHW